MAGAAAVIVLFYLCNRFLWVPSAEGWLRRLLAGHFADLLAGGLILVLANGALTLGRLRPLVRVLPASALILGCGLFWECATPLYLSRSVADPWDLLAYWLGGMAALIWLRKGVR